MLIAPKDPNDEKRVVLEIRTGTGGDEAGLFAHDLRRMYSRFAERMGWKVEVLSLNGSGAAAVKEIIALIEGARVYRRLKYESVASTGTPAGDLAHEIDLLGAALWLTPEQRAAARVSAAAAGSSKPAADR